MFAGFLATWRWVLVLSFTDKTRSFGRPAPCCCIIAGVDHADAAVLEAALAQHAILPGSDSGPGNSEVTSSHHGQTHAIARTPDDKTLQSPAEMAVDSMMEALCCPITHVRLCPI